MPLPSWLAWLGISTGPLRTPELAAFLNHHAAMDSGPDPHTLVRLRREAALSCDRDGRLLWVDEAATHLLGLSAGQHLTACALDGTTDRLTALVDAALRGPVRGWEAPVCVDGRPATMAFSAETSGDVVSLVGNLMPDDVGERLQQVNGAMGELAALHRQSERQQRELQRRHDELLRLHRELGDSSLGLVALHEEVEEKADSLRRLSEVKSRVVSNASHELRTPLNSIISLTALLLSRADGELSDEQERQVTFIRRSAEVLAQLVDDMLDLSKAELGKVRLRTSRFTVATLFGGLRGMFRPLHKNADVALVFDDPADDLWLETDESKVSQVLRNFVSNALKFTERGEVRVSARVTDAGRVALTVSDTGIGIAAADQQRVFEEFTQVDNPLQRKVRGTGLGLSLARSLASVLGGEVTLESEPGVGSRFTLTIPVTHDEVGEMRDMERRSEALDPARQPILVLEDDRQTLFLYEAYLRNSGFQILPARTADEARAILQRVTPAAIVLDVMLDGETSWPFLAELKSASDTRDIPVLVVTVVNRERQARALGADEFLVKPLDEASILRKLAALSQRRRTPITTVLVVDDDEVSRYMVRKVLEGTSYEVIEAHDGPQAIALARSRLPQVIFLDFVMPGSTAFDVIDELKSDPTTRSIPIIIHTSQQLDAVDRSRLARDTSSILPKQSMNREAALGRIREALLTSGLGRAGA